MPVTGDYFIISTSLRGLPQYMRDVLVPMHKSKVKFLGSLTTPGGYEEVMAAVCDAWGITRDQGQLALLDTCEEEEDDNDDDATATTATVSSADSSFESSRRHRRRSKAAATFGALMTAEKEPAQLISSQREWELFWDEHRDDISEERGWWFEIVERPSLPFAFTMAANISEKKGATSATASQMTAARTSTPPAQPGSSSGSSTTSAVPPPSRDDGTASAHPFADIPVLERVKDSVLQAFGQRVPQNGTEAAHRVLDTLENIIGLVGPVSGAAADTQRAQQATSGNAAPAGMASTAAARPTETEGGSSQTHREEAAAQPLPSAQPVSDQQPQMTDFERLMARSRAQGEALNAFFGNVTQRRAERLNPGSGSRSNELGSDNNSTDTPPSEPLRESEIPVASRPDSSYASATPTSAYSIPSAAVSTSTSTSSVPDAVRAQNDHLASLWEKRLQQMGHELPETHTYLNRFPQQSVGRAQSTTATLDSQQRQQPPQDDHGKGKGTSTSTASPSTRSEGSASEWEMLRQETNEGTADVNSSTNTNTSAPAPTSSELPTVVQATTASPSIEQNNQTLADAFTEMLARSRNAQSSGSGGQ